MLIAPTVRFYLFTRFILLRTKILSHILLRPTALDTGVIHHWSSEGAYLLDA